MEAVVQAFRNTDATGDEGFMDAPERQGRQSAIKKKITEAKDIVKQKSKRVVDNLTARPEEWQDNDDPNDDIKQNPAFDPSRLVARQRLTVGGTSDKILGTTVAVGKAIASPKTTAKRTAVSKIAVQDRPYLSQQADFEYIEAHTDLQNAQSSTNASDDEVETTRQRVTQLEDTRDARKVAWTTNRHISRVAVIESQTPRPPKIEDFYIQRSDSGDLKLDWHAYSIALGRYRLKCFAVQRMGEVDVRPQQAFNKDVCIKYIERILIATSPWQSWFLSVRSLYRWEDPKKTIKWALIWFCIWWADYTMTFVYCWTVYIVLESRFSANRTGHLQASYCRARNDNTRAFRFNELIERHGPGEWLDPLIEQAGPVVQMQLSDAADFLEILANFYDWRYPAKTWATLFWFLTAILIGAFSPTGHSLKVVWMFTLLSFFLGRPIASHHPQYRHTVNALKWIFWEIPTNTEWSMAYLRERAQETREKLLAKMVEESNEWPSHLDAEHQSPAIQIDSASDTDSFVSAASFAAPADLLEKSADEDEEPASLDPNMVLQSFSTRYKGLQCRLLILPDGVLLRHASPLKASRRNIRFVAWKDFRELRKINDSTAAKVFDLEGLELVVGEKKRSAHPRAIDTYGSRRQSERLKCPSEEDIHSNSQGKDETVINIDFTDDENDVTYSHQTSRETFRSIKLHALKKRDLLFNSLIGFSGLSFQVLQPVAPGDLAPAAGDDADNMTDDASSDDQDGTQTTQRIAKRKIVRAAQKIKRKVRRTSGGPDGEADGIESTREARGGGKEVRETTGRRKIYDPYQASRSDSFWEGWFA